MLPTASLALVLTSDASAADMGADVEVVVVVGAEVVVTVGAVIEVVAVAGGAASVVVAVVVGAAVVVVVVVVVLAVVEIVDATGSLARRFWRTSSGIVLRTSSESD